MGQPVHPAMATLGLKKMENSFGKVGKMEGKGMYMSPDIGDMHSPYYANVMMSSEVRAASTCKNQANLQLPAMRDSVYEVESPWVGISITFSSNFL